MKKYIFEEKDLIFRVVSNAGHTWCYGYSVVYSSNGDNIEPDDISILCECTTEDSAMLIAAACNSMLTSQSRKSRMVIAHIKDVLQAKERGVNVEESRKQIEKENADAILIADAEARKQKQIANSEKVDEF